MPLAPHTTRGPRGHRQLPHPLSHGKPRLPAAPPPCGPRAPREVPPHGPRQPLLRSARGQHSPRLAAAPRDALGRSPAWAQQRRPAPSFLAEARASLQGDVVLPSRSPAPSLASLTVLPQGTLSWGEKPSGASCQKGTKASPVPSSGPSYAAQGGQLRRAREQGRRGGAGHPMCAGTRPARDPLGTSCTCSGPFSQPPGTVIPAGWRRGELGPQEHAGPGASGRPPSCSSRGHALWFWNLLPVLETQLGCPMDTDLGKVT